MLDRDQAVPALIGDHRDFLIISGLAGVAKDMQSLTEGAANAFLMGGAMGGATMMGLGLALARPDRRVLVVTGDGELLMNVGSLATAGVMNPRNLAIVCVDNEHYGETGNQDSHTGRGVDLEIMAKGAGIEPTQTVWKESDIARAKALIRGDGLCFVVLKVSDSPPPQARRSFDAPERRTAFRRNLLGKP